MFSEKIKKEEMFLSALVVGSTPNSTNSATFRPPEVIVTSGGGGLSSVPFPESDRFLEGTVRPSGADLRVLKAPEAPEASAAEAGEHLGQGGLLPAAAQRRAGAGGGGRRLRTRGRRGSGSGGQRGGFPGRGGAAGALCWAV